MKTLLVASFVEFWTAGSGHRSRLSRLLDYLQSRVRVTVYHAGPLSQLDRAVIRERYPLLQMEAASTVGTITYGEYVVAFGDFVNDKSFDFVLVEYIELSAVLEYLPPSTITMLDTHDLVTHRIGSFQNIGIPYDGIELTLDDELDLFRCYDHILFIQQNELDSVAPWIDRDRLVLVPHPVSAVRTPLREAVQNIGFVASPYAPNIEALRWFLDQVWQPIHENFDVHLQIYGNIREAFPGYSAEGVHWQGFIANLETAYRNCDLIVNPVRCGAGLKIKNVEALAHGLPLVTTTHGSAGMEDAADAALLVANSPGAFTAAISRLILDADLRQTLAEGAYRYAKEHFSEERCFAKLASIVH